MNLFQGGKQRKPSCMIELGGGDCIKGIRQLILAVRIFFSVLKEAGCFVRIITRPSAPSIHPSAAAICNQCRIRCVSPSVRLSVTLAAVCCPRSPALPPACSPIPEHEHVVRRRGRGPCNASLCETSRVGVKTCLNPTNELNRMLCGVEIKCRPGPMFQT